MWGADRERLERELDEELAFHLEGRAAELEAGGLDPEEARRAALAEFGDLDGARRYCRREDRRRRRRAWWGRVASAVADDVVGAYRGLARRPRAVTAPLAILAVAVALNALVFSVVRGVLLAPLPFPDPGSVAVVREVTGTYGLSAVSYPVLDAWRREARTVERMAGHLEGESVLLVGRTPVRARTAAVTEGWFDLLDRPFVLGGPLPPGAHAPGAAPEAVISEGFWRRALGADPGVLGRSVSLEGEEVRVVGVVRRGAIHPDGTEVWLALEARSPDLLEVAGAKILNVVARVRPGATLDEVALELGGISAGVEGGTPSAAATPVADALLGDVRRPLLLLQGAVLLVLLAACANAGGMLLARAVRRRTELAVRAAAGAGALRLARGLLLEGFLIGACAGALGLLAAALSLGPALALVPGDLPRSDAIRLDPVVSGLALALALATGVATALVPALSGARTPPATLLRTASGGHGTPWLRRVLEGLVVGQVALAVILTAGAGLLLRSFLATIAEDPGFDPRRITVVEVALPAHRYPDAASRTAFATRLLEGARGLPGVTVAALGRNLPISGSSMTSPLLVEGSGTTTPVQIALVSADYFEVLGIPLVEGSGFGEADRPGGRPVLVVDGAVRDEEGRALAVGARAHSFFGGADGPDRMRDVVGVAGGVRHDGLRSEPAPVAYEPFFQKGGAGAFTLLLRSTAPAASVAAEARTLLSGLDPELPTDAVGTMAARLSRSLAGPRFYTVVLSLFGALAVLLALAGCHAGLAHRVAARRREIGVRMALGASQPGVRGMIVRRGLVLTATGAVAGTVLSLPATRLLESQFYGVTSGDPTTYAALLILLFAAAALASDLPARRASGVDPVEVLRDG